ncbi:MAG: hypothetical protein DRJ51_03400 [Thermoprotei archaeon]|nr:MAG: hypothetical protein DRJ51_03400 [Thermoprotei archaeon]
MIRLQVERILGRKILLLGDVGTGKTLLTSRILEKLVELGYEKHITVIDMAPEKMGHIGGTLGEYTRIVERVTYLRPRTIYAPRTTARNQEELLFMARKNAESIDSLLTKYLSQPTEILIINDVTLYFHAGDIRRVLGCLSHAKTFVANAYYGQKISCDYGTGVTLRERKLVERLAKEMDIILNLDSIGGSNFFVDG